MAHIFFIDPIEKLNIKKDSTLMMALSFQEKGLESYILFEKDFSIANDVEASLVLYKFSGEFKEDGFYLESFVLGEVCDYKLSKNDILHMRIDPPYDTRYQRYLWILDYLVEKSEIEVVNMPLKIMKYNEKLVAMKNLENSHASFVGSSESEFLKFVERLKVSGHKEVILKPLDLYSGIGVEKVSISDSLIHKFSEKVEAFAGAIVCQPFVEDVYNGEYRSIYFDGVEIGTIVKRPQKGEFLANIAQGAHYESAKLESDLQYKCDMIAQELKEDGVRFIAFDLLGGKINEINITCPGLLVEVSYAHQKNLASLIADSFL